MTSIDAESFAAGRVPRREWKGILLWTCGLVICAVGLGEWLWRSQGLGPASLDSMALWSYHRASIGTTRQEVVLLGASRMQLGFDTHLFRQLYPEYHLTQLALDGAAPLAAFRDLANDSSFHGTVLCSLTAEGIFRERWDDQQAYVDYCRNEYNAVEHFDVVAADALRSRLVFLRPELGLKGILRGLASGQLIPPDVSLEMSFDRCRLYDTTLEDDMPAECQRLVDVARADYQRLMEHSDGWLEDARQVAAWAASIEARGGQVIFVRLPTAGALWELDQKTFPRSEYWDRFARLVVDEGHAQTLHFADAPRLIRFPLPDLSHLDRRDVPGFTQALLTELVARGYLPESSVGTL